MSSVWGSNKRTISPSFHTEDAKLRAETWGSEDWEGLCGTEETWKLNSHLQCSVIIIPLIYIILFMYSCAKADLFMVALWVLVSIWHIQVDKIECYDLCLRYLPSLDDSLKFLRYFRFYFLIMPLLHRGYQYSSITQKTDYDLFSSNSIFFPLEHTVMTF